MHTQTIRTTPAPHHNAPQHNAARPIGLMDALLTLLSISSSDPQATRMLAASLLTEEAWHVADTLTGQDIPVPTAAQLTEMSLSHSGDLRGLLIPAPLALRQSLRPGSLERVRRMPALLARQDELRRTIDAVRLKLWSPEYAAVQGLLQGGTLNVPGAPGDTTIRLKRTGELTAWEHALSGELGTVQATRHAGATLIRATHQISGTSHLPWEESSVTLLSDHGTPRCGYLPLTRLLEHTRRVTPSDVPQLPNGLVMHYHGPTGGEYALRSDAERVMILSHKGHVTELRSAISGTCLPLTARTVNWLTI